MLLAGAIMATQSPLSGGLLLDAYTGARFAYSTRHLRTDYTGSALRVRRDSDNAEQDIGFDGSGDLDESSLISFVGSANGYVVTWYDQSTNANHATQSTTSYQGQIVSSGVVLKENAIPTIKAGTSTMYDTNLSGYIEKSIFCVANLASNPGESVSRLCTSFSGTGAVNNELILHRAAASNTLRFYDGGSIITVSGATAAHHQVSAIRTSSTISVSVDGGTPASTSSNSNANVNTYKLFEESTTVGDIGEQPENIQEIIFYDSDQSTNRNAINTDQKNYFGTP